MGRLILLFFLGPFILHSQIAKDYAILVTATVNENPASIELNWPLETATSYFVYKKLKSDVLFPSSFELLSGTATSYLDTAVVLGESYEYYVKRNSSPGAVGYINAGIKTNGEINHVEVKGKIIVLVDSAQADTLKMELDRFFDDLEGEGWTVLNHEISQNKTVVEVKQLIIDEYNKDPDNTNSLLLFGHIPVPYSGNLVPDGHSNHVGAWPADAFYGDIDGNWTDVNVNNTSGSDPRTKNIPGDGKYDQSTIPSSVELEVGRIDLHDMPAFAKSETELLRDYLNKNHAYRIKAFTVKHRALIDDNFGGFGGEAFAASAWKSFSTFFGPDSIYSNVGTSYDYRTNLNADSYLWSYGCGGGGYTSCSGIGNTNQIAGDSLQSVFTMLFGSYFGDWDKTNNFLRAPLAQGLTLTNAWSGRPHWYFHHMGLGENIGYSFKMSINNTSTYSQSFKKSVHIALMGDPTLKMYAIAPPSNLQLTEVNNRVNLSWDASSDNILGYYVYRKDSLEGLYRRVNNAMITGTTYIDSFFTNNGTFYYSVRAVRLEETPSGSFYNFSGGSIGSIQTIYTKIAKHERLSELSVIPNPAANKFHVVYKNLESGHYLFSIQNVSGQKVEEHEYSLSDKGSIDFDASKFDNGIYILILKNSHQVYSTKLLVSH